MLFSVKICELVVAPLATRLEPSQHISFYLQLCCCRGQKLFHAYVLNRCLPEALLIIDLTMDAVERPERLSQANGGALRLLLMVMSCHQATCSLDSMLPIFRRQMAPLKYQNSNA